MNERIAELLYPTVVKQLMLNNVNEVVFFKAGINRFYFNLVERACQELHIKLIARGTGMMAGANEIELILKNPQCA